MSHQVGLILMMGGKVTSTMSWEKAKVWKYMLAGFVKDTGSQSTPQRTHTWRDGSATNVMRDGIYSRDSKARALRRSFTSGVVSVLRRSKILGYATRAWLLRCVAHTSLTVDGDPWLVCGGAAAGP